MDSARKTTGGRIAIGLALLIPSLTYVWVAAGWQQSQLSRPTGDEPHYLAIADAITADHSLDVRAAYARDAIAKRAFGPIDWENHTRTVPRGVYSVHSPGISAFVAVPYANFGVVGARVALALLTGLIPLLFFRIARALDLQRGDSAWLAVAASFGLPFLAAAGQVFPDLPSGVLLLALTLLLLRINGARNDARASLLATGLLAALLPWLHVKNIAPAVIFSCAALLLDARRHQLTWKRSMRVLGPFAGSLTALAGYHVFAFGTLLGPFTAESAGGATLGQAGMAILGLHLDQAQGIFLHQPLFLLGCVGLAIAFRLSPIVLASLALAYASVVLAHGVHFDTYGGWAIGGRFMWTLAALWFIPLALLHRGCGPLGRHLLRLACALSVWWQLVLMTDWVPGGAGPLILARSSDLFERNSYFTGEIRRWLPSFYDFEGYLNYPPNLWWIGLAAALMALGLGMAIRRGRQVPAGAVPPPRARRRLIQIVSTVGAVGLATGVSLARVSGGPIDLMELFPQAERRPKNAGSETIRLVDQAIGSETRRAILSRAPSRVIWTFTVPDDGVFRTAIGVDESASGDGLVFRIGASADTNYRDLLVRELNPRARAEDRGWVPVSIDLSAYRRWRINLILNTEPALRPGAETVPAVGYWANPVVDRDKTGRR